MATREGRRVDRVSGGTAGAGAGAAAAEATSPNGRRHERVACRGVQKSKSTSAGQRRHS